MNESQYPKYYEVDDVLVKLVLEGDEVAGYTIHGTPYPIGKAMVEGVQITEEEYNKLSAQI